MKLLKTTIVAIGATFLLSCDPVDDKPALIIPTTYDATDFQKNTVTERKILADLSAMATETKKGRSGTKIDLGVVKSTYSGVEPVTTSAFDTQTDKLFRELVAASGGQKFKPTGIQPGVYGDYLLSEKGLDLEEVIDKSLYGAALYSHAVELSRNPDATTADKMLAIMGTSPAFPGSNSATKHPVPDAFIANYIARRDKNDGNGFYTALKNNFIKLQAATKAGNDYNDERDEAIVGILENWEKGSAATTINYLQSVTSKLSSTTLDEATISSAMHSLSEAIGFQQGLLSVSRKIITDKQIDEEILALLKVQTGKVPGTIDFIISPAIELPRLQEAISRLKKIYGFTDQQIEDFKKNWVNEQGR